MKIIEQSHEIQAYNNIGMIEQAGRTCYQTGEKIGCTRGYEHYKYCPHAESCETCPSHSSNDFAGMLIRRGHHAMIEFGDIIVKFITNRGVTHELVRHRHCSFAQESTRYVKYEGDMEFIKPVWINWAINEDQNGFITNEETPNDIPAGWWTRSMDDAETTYKHMLHHGWKAQQAREILPNSLKTEIVMKANIREWRHILTLRCAKASHPQMIALMKPLLAELKTKIPVVFDDLNFERVG